MEGAKRFVRACAERGIDWPTLEKEIAVTAENAGLELTFDQWLELVDLWTDAEAAPDRRDVERERVVRERALRGDHWEDIAKQLRVVDLGIDEHQHLFELWNETRPDTAAAA